MNELLKFVWEIHRSCNYRCPYCWNDNKLRDLSKEYIYLPIEEWVRLWNYIYDKYGSVNISISGGEPSIYPSFFELIKKLSKKHSLSIVTNLSFDVEPFIAQVDSKKVNVDISFHPLFVKLEKFIRKALLLKESGFTDRVFYVSYPPQLKQMSYYKKEFEQAGLSFLIQPFWGKYLGKSYPESYTEDERNLIATMLEDFQQIDYRLNQKKTKGKLCRAGQLSAFINNKGITFRCGSDKDPKGNFLDKNFKLLENPLPCTSEFCPCNDYIYLLKDVKMALVLTPGLGKNNSPYVLASHSAILRQRNYEIFVFDINNTFYHLCDDKDKKLWDWEESAFWSNPDSVSRFVSENNTLIEQIVNNILFTNSDIIVFWVYSSTKLMSLELAKRIKEKDIKRIIIFGGTECQQGLSARRLIEEEPVDVVVIDESDQTLAELTEIIRRTGHLDNCLGTIYKKDGKVVDCRERLPLKDLDFLPFADFSDSDSLSCKDHRELKKILERNEIGSKMKLQDENEKLNEYEHNLGKINLDSTPPNFLLQIDGPCNSECTFCSRPSQYSFFSLEEYKRKFEKKLSWVIRRAKRLGLTGAGELLLLPDAKETLSYLDENFPHVEKSFATNGSTLSHEFVEFISQSKSRYTLQISLHTSDAKIHKAITGTNNFEKIIENLNCLLKIRKRANNPEIYLMFLATTKNIENFPDFVRFAAQLGVHRVICQYNSIYNIEQKYLSCYFKKEITNQIFIEAEEIAKTLDIALDLPWKFNQLSYPSLPICKEPWCQVMINSRGEILPCCLFGNFSESLEKKDFMDIWNGEVYQDIRRCLTDGEKGYCEVCLKNKPSSVNNFKAHVITRGKSDDELGELLEVDKIEKVFETKKHSDELKTCFTWDMQYGCNYKCSYCHLSIEGSRDSEEDTYPGFNKLIRIWDNILDKYGNCVIDLTGGEPSTYPGFIDLVSHLTKRTHMVRITTNLSFDIDAFINKVDSKKAIILSSFHPEFIGLEEFLEKTEALKQRGFDITVSYVAYPSNLEKMRVFKDKFNEEGLPFIIHIFRGRFHERLYPDSYTEEEKKLIIYCGGECYDSRTNKTLAEHYLNRQKRRKGEKRLCRMGQKYAKIYPNGDVHRCCKRKQVKKLGNIFTDKELRLLNKPALCEIEECPCWKAMIVGEEDRWMPHWL